MQENNTLQDLYDFYGNVRNAIDSNVDGNTDKQGMFYALQGVAFCIGKLVNVYGYHDLLGMPEMDKVGATKSNWCDLNELCKRHPELCKSKIKSRQWRLENDFPCKSGYKCKQMYYEPDVQEWIMRNKNRKKC